MEEIVFFIPLSVPDLQQVIRCKFIQKARLVLIVYCTRAIDVKYVHVHTVYQQFIIKVA